MAAGPRDRRRGRAGVEGTGGTAQGGEGRMLRKLAKALLAAAVLAPLGLGGCNPFGMGIATPIPVPAWVTERMEEKICYKNDFRTPIMPPIREGYPLPTCEDPPGEREVLRAMPHIVRG